MSEKHLLQDCVLFVCHFVRRIWCGLASSTEKKQSDIILRKRKAMRRVLNMIKLISCGFNMDTASVELRYRDGSMVSIYCPAVEDLVAENRMQRAELD